MVPRWRWKQAVVEWSARCVLFTTIDLVWGCHTHIHTHQSLYYISIYTDAMQTFAQSEDKWYKTWPESEEDRAMRMYANAFYSFWELCADGPTLTLFSDYVKMWEQC